MVTNASSTAATPNGPAPSRAASVRLPLAVVQEQAAAGDDQPDWGAARCLFAATATAALAGIPLGLLLGYWSGTGRMADVPWAGLVQAHGQVQLYGWIGLSILGVTFHAMAHLFRSATPPARLTWAVLVLQLAGVALRLAAPLAPWVAGAGGAGGAASAASAAGAWLLLGSAVAFAVAFAITLAAHVRTLPRSSLAGGAPERRPPAVLPRYLLSGLLLWALALLVNLDAAIEALRTGMPAPGAIGPTADGLIVGLTTGGLALVAAGMSLRVVAGWLDLPAPNLVRASQAWWPLVAAAVLRGLRPGFDALSPAAGDVVGIMGSLLWALGVGWYLPSLRGLWAPSAVRAGGTGGAADPPLAWFVRTAYAWFALSGLLAALEAVALALGRDGAGPLGVAAVADAGRHALLFGFLGLLTAGLTGRLPIAFLDVGDAGIRASRHAYRGAFWLLLVATACRVAAPLAGSLRSAALVLAGSAGALGLCCLLVALGQVLWLTWLTNRRARPHLQPA